MNLQEILDNFEFILFVLTIVTGIIWFLDVYYLARRRRAKANLALAEFDARHAKLKAEGIKLEDSGRVALEANIPGHPTWVANLSIFFPVITLVLLFRSFLYEPFKIPSSSMVPTLLIGDLILVNKFTYGIRLPIINKKIIEVGKPQRGDVMVFKYPKDTSRDYIKRVIGAPGDKIVYKNKRLIVNGKKLSYQPLPDYRDEDQLISSKQFSENLTGVKHRIINIEAEPAFVDDPYDFTHRELCNYDMEGFACTVPPGNYFMMGDNRDNSVDSRYWGFVPDRDIIGKACFVWLNLSNFPSNMHRIGSVQ